jgi:uncharacterized membrane protein YfcA
VLWPEFAFIAFAVALLAATVQSLVGPMGTLLAVIIVVFIGNAITTTIVVLSIYVVIGGALVPYFSWCRWWKGNRWDTTRLTVFTTAVPGPTLAVAERDSVFPGKDSRAVITATGRAGRRVWPYAM